MRQFGYDRLLARIFSADDADQWVVKGAAALLARLSGESRHSLDIDLYREGVVDTNEAEQSLRRAAARDLGDMFTFVIHPGTMVAKARRFRVDALLGPRVFATFPVDLVVGLAMTGLPSDVLPSLPEIPGMQRVPYRVYPLADHLADKVCAIHECHDRVGGPAVPSSRYRDLADIILIARRSSVDAHAVTVALRSEERRRGLTLPTKLEVQETPEWRAGYGAVARGVALLRDIDFEGALALARSLLDPILDGAADGRWNPDSLGWES
jgi:hypothetical protein